MKANNKEKNTTSSMFTTTLLSVIIMLFIFNFNFDAFNAGAASGPIFGGGTPGFIVKWVTPPPPPEVSSVTVTEPNYCVSGPAITVSWTYSDPSGSPQRSYQVQIDNNDSFSSPEIDTGKLNSSSGSWFSGQGQLIFDERYRARVMVWNLFDIASGWQPATSCVGPGCDGSSGRWRTPVFPYPQVDFNWTANGILNNPSPPLNKPVTFADQTVFNGPSSGRSWSWLFGDGGTSTTQNPLHLYVAESTYYVTLTATDNASQSCARTKGPLIIQKPIPKWREVAPR